MKIIEILIEEIATIWKKRGQQARNYLLRVREMKERFGDGFAIVYCWFYSVPQKWIIIEPKIFELIAPTNSFDLDTMIEIPAKRLALSLKAVIFFKELSTQLKNFCRAIKTEYGSWDNFVRELIEQDLFKIFRRLRKYRNIRLTFKNLAAMKTFVGMDDDLIILDVHVGRVLGMNKGELGKYRVQEGLFNNLLMFSEKITHELKRKGFENITMIEWSLAIWFDEVRIPANRLLLANAKEDTLTS